MPRLQVNILGGFQARLSSGNTLDIAARKTRALLAFLALPAGREHSRDKLMSLLWSDRSNEQARNSLRQALTELGRALGAGETSLLVKGRDTLALDPQAVEVDAVLFEQLAPSDDIDDLRRAAALYAGD
ncbi:MAG TPA: alpha/beta hydrolase, partial [Aestuariivirga sp.]|nr:alpha/beta hydrolase [Aestuariivirga sp.]